MAFGELLGCNDPKQMNQLKGFAFDCLLEYLDSKFCPISDSGFRTCTKLPSSMTKEILIIDIIDEVEEWTQFVGLILDELMEWDMIHSLVDKQSIATSLHSATSRTVQVMVMFSLLFYSGTSQEEIQMKDCDTREGIVANVDVSTARQPISREMESSKETGCRAPEDLVLGINDCDFFNSSTTMNMCSKCQKDRILLKQEHPKLAATSRKDVVHRSSSSDESKFALSGAAVASTDLASQISQVKSKEGLKKCTACRKRVGLTGFSCKCGDLFCAVHHYSDKHNCPFDYRIGGQNVMEKANPIIVAEKLNKI
ncbi:hypothetical protein CQW23_30958 [Capsicum baccatum]|uniref:Zinc finger A20 and AN1 domain-containing stress-associated protein 8 n=1 Tax=Capsicum baccatum TaxID=33114 RepID=A0A2G2V906_CAPBA|nr:hypothetical protein CQW23_30958 [Capsicum baccatum]